MKIDPRPLQILKSQLQLLTEQVQQLEKIQETGDAHDARSFQVSHLAEAVFVQSKVLRGYGPGLESTA